MPEICDVCEQLARQLADIELRIEELIDRRAGVAWPCEDADSRAEATQLEDERRQTLALYRNHKQKSLLHQPNQ